MSEQSELNRLCRVLAVAALACIWFAILGVVCELDRIANALDRAYPKEQHREQR